MLLQCKVQFNNLPQSARKHVVGLQLYDQNVKKSCIENLKRIPKGLCWFKNLVEEMAECVQHCFKTCFKAFNQKICIFSGKAHFHLSVTGNKVLPGTLSSTKLFSCFPANRPRCNCFPNRGVFPAAPCIQRILKVILTRM